MIKSEPFIINCFAVFLIGFVLLTNRVHAMEQNIIKQYLKSENKQLMIGQSEIAMADLVRTTYQYNQYQLFWQNSALVTSLLKAINDSFQQGLVPEDYHLPELYERLKNNLTQSDDRVAQLDILLTDALLRLIYHLHFGKVVPGHLDADWNLKRDLLTTELEAKVNYILQSNERLTSFLQKNLDLGPFYQGLIRALVRYRQLQQDGGWKAVVPGAVIKPGMSDSRMPQIIARLQITGDLDKATINPEAYTYDELLETGVKHFQQRHNLEVDGIIGKGTLEAMNIPVAQRIDQIRANLERIRWVKQNIEDEFVLVNIAGFKVYYFKDNKLIWSSRAQVGKDYRKTPVFRDEIKYLVFNPTWTVPPTILSKDILPRIKREPGYLKQKNMSVIDAKGNKINTDDIDWSSVSGNNFPYWIRQEPGPDNALGRVKIMFPNKHLVYLHDTPSQANFNKTERAFSSGCIRVENPFELVELLLNNTNKWNQTRFKEILESGKMQNVNLPQSVPVLLLYFTAELNDKGDVTFFKDIYSRDEKIINGLYEPFKLVKPEHKS